MDIFRLFTNTAYTFLKIVQVVEGNKVETEYEAVGVFKLRDNMTASDDLEISTGNATIHIKPNETFLADVGGVLTGHGVRVDGIDYRITGFSEGKDFDTGEVEFYRAELKRESIVAWEISESPLT